MGVMGLAVVPIYLRLLGAAQWGMIAVCVSLQATLSIVDAGLGQIMPRDVARCEPLRAHAVYLKAYLLVGVLVFSIGQASCAWWVSWWFPSSPARPEFPIYAIRLLLTQFLFQFINNANIGYWNGIEEQQTANVRQVFFATAKHSVALSILFWIRRDVISYLAAFSAVSMSECLLNLRRVRREAKKGGFSSVSFREVFRLYGEAGTLAIGIIAGLLATQVDRIILSRSVSLQQFGYYALAASLGLAAMQFQYPLMRAYLPRLARVSGDTWGREFRNLAALVFCLCVVPCVIMAIWAPSILHFWLGNPTAESAAIIPLCLILIAVALNALYNIVYQRMLIVGSGVFIVAVNLLCFCAACVSTLWLVDNLGINAGGVAWIVASACQLLLGIGWFMTSTSARSAATDRR